MQTLLPEFADAASPIGGFYSIDADTLALEVLTAAGDLKGIVITSPRGEYVNNRAYEAIIGGDASELTADDYKARRAEILRRNAQSAALRIN